MHHPEEEEEDDDEFLSDGAEVGQSKDKTKQKGVYWQIIELLKDTLCKCYRIFFLLETCSKTLKSLAARQSLPDPDSLGESPLKVFEWGSLY